MARIVRSSVAGWTLTLGTLPSSGTACMLRGGHDDPVSHPPAGDRLGEDDGGRTTRRLSPPA